MTLSNTDFTIIVPADVSKEEALKRRQIYLRPFLLYTINSYIAEFLFLTVAIVFFSGWEDIATKLLWTMVVCPLAMGGAMGGLTVVWLTDRYYGRAAIIRSSLLHLVLLGGCNYLCFTLDRLFFGYFGARTHPMWFHLRYPFIFLSGVKSAQQLFTDNGQKELAKLFGI
jgi:hypothetical protein